MAFFCYRQVFQLKLPHSYTLHSLCVSRLLPSFIRQIHSCPALSLKGKESKPLSFLQSDAVHYRIRDEQYRNWKRKERAYKYILLPTSTTAFFVIAYLIFSGGTEYQATEEQLERLQKYLDYIERKKRGDIPTNSNN